VAKAKTALRTNETQLVEMSVLGEVDAPTHSSQWRVSPDGVPALLPGVGGITYNVKVGDSAVDWAADHVEPGVSVKTEKTSANAGLNTLSCVGNTATVVSGDAKNGKGIVTGKHGGIEHVLVDFPDSVLAKLVVGDKIQVRSRGLGLKLLDMPHIALMNMDPDLLRKMNPRRDGDRLVVRVARRVPAALMGSGLGSSHTFSGDYDIQLFDKKVVEEFALDKLRLGDIVALQGADHTFGRIYDSGAVSIGVVVHTCCTTAGHGPGVTSLMSNREGLIGTVLDAKANLADYLGIGRRRVRRRKTGKR
jgi:hypothetical protein